MIGLKIKKPEQKFKILIIITLLFTSLFLHYYFLLILKMGIIFSHFCYIPIILACFWWKNKGLVVPIFLGGSMIYFSLFSGLVVEIINNLIRGLIHILVGIIVIILSKQISRAEQKLRESEEKYRFISEKSNDLISIFNNKFKLEYINEYTYKRLTGYSKEDMIGKARLDLIHPDDLKATIETYKKTYNIGEGSVEFRFKKKDGNYIWLGINGRTFIDKNGEKKSLITARDITDRKKAEEKLKHINSVLRAISNVNQLIIKVKDREGLIQGACNNLIETRGFFNAWIALLDDLNNVILTAEAGLGENFSSMIELLKKGELTECSRNAITQSDLIIHENPKLTCTDCPLSKIYEGKSAMTLRLEYREKIFGWLSVSVPRNVVKDEDEQKLFKEVANDIAFALYSIELEEEHEKVEKSLKERMKELEAFYELSKIVEEPDITEEILIQRIVNMIPKSMQYPEITCARIKLKGQEFKTENFEETKWVLKSDIKIFGELEGTFEIFYLKEKPEIDEGPFIKEEKALIDALTERLGRIIQSMEVEQKLKESEEWLFTTLRSIGDAVIATDTKGKIIFLNPVAESLTCWNQEEALEKPIEDIFNIVNEETHKQVENPISRVLREGVAVGLADHTVLIDKNGKEIPIADSGAPIKDDEGNIIGVVLIFRDITERKKAEELIKKFTEELEEKVKIRTAELDEAINKLNETIKQKDLYVKEVLKSSQFKTEFMATMSHELRTPLNAIIGFSDILAEEIYGGLNKEQKDFIKDVRSSGEHLFNMINQILDISKIGTGEMRLIIKKFPLNNLINQIRSTVKPLLDEKKLKFEVIGLETEKFIEADQIRLKEILYNLLSNAIKFTNAGGIKLKFMEKENQFEFYIIDTGIGIAKEDYDLIFKEFKRVDSPFVNSTPGTGLGLPLTKKLINMLGGNISFTSELGKGATFKFTIPKNLG